MKVKFHLLVLSVIISFAAGCGKEEEENVCFVVCPVGAGCNKTKCIDSLAGDYAWVGADTSKITRVNNNIYKLVCRGYELQFTTSPFANVPPNTYAFATMISSWEFVQVVFTKPYNDSAYLYYNSSIPFKAVKIH